MFSKGVCFRVSLPVSPGGVFYASPVAGWSSAPLKRASPIEQPLSAIEMSGPAPDVSVRALRIPAQAAAQAHITHQRVSREFFALPRHGEGGCASGGRTA